MVTSDNLIYFRATAYRQAAVSVWCPGSANYEVSPNRSLSIANVLGKKILKGIDIMTLLPVSFGCGCGVCNCRLFSA
eukprot:g73310.t1